MFLRDLARRMATTRADQLAYAGEGETRTWSEIRARATLFASVMQDQGLRKGERAGLLALDRMEMIEHWHACLMTGVVRTGLNWRYAPAEIEHIVRDGDLRLILVQDLFVDAIRPLIAHWQEEGRVIIGFGGEHGLDLDYETLMAASTGQVELPELEALDPIALSYTSGSTGLPKGAILNQIGGWTQLFSSPYAGGFGPDDVILNNLPGSGFPIYIHTYGMSSGATTIIPGRFDAARTIELVQQYGVTVMFCVPTMLNAVEQACREAGVTLPTLRLVAFLGSPVVPAIVERARETFGCAFQNWYGSTEANGAITMMRPSDLSGDPERDKVLMTAVGRPLPHVDIEIRDDDDKPVARGESGEICVRGPVLSGYLNMPEQTADALRGGWFHMGDIGHMDEDGRIFLSDRKYFMIVSGGYNVYPAVVENVLADHPDIAEVAVVGAAHPKWGECVVAVVVPAAGRDTAADAEAMIAYAASRVGKWEVPKHIEFVPALPIGSTGKIQKREIKGWFELEPERLPWNTVTV